MKKKTETEAVQQEKSVKDILDSLTLAYVSFPETLFGTDDMFVGTASEDYLHNYGIHKDDTILFRRQDRADYGQIVCALVDEALCMRHYAFDDNKGLPYLKSANPNVEDVYDFHIIGIVAWIIRQFDNTGSREVLAS